MAASENALVAVRKAVEAITTDRADLLLRWRDELARQRAGEPPRAHGS